ncbi:hypothetical protein MKW94_027354 [Papaver nudicaule]|uniref:Uncharacterized protein n=1 Tax=Papaver nudicaule TaxID=74823 RepID=A0AA41VIK6_PAPNU|nr:hypothetical protein [Papaver nudicaule]
MPSRFRYLTKEAPDRPVRWPWLPSVFFSIWNCEELTGIILLTSAVLAIAEAPVPNSIDCQSYLISVAGFIGLAALKSFIPETLFWVFLVGLFCFAKFVKKKDNVSSAMPVAAVSTAVGEPWMRKNLPEEYANVEVDSSVRRLPVPLVGAALAIGCSQMGSLPPPDLDDCMNMDMF